MDQQQRTESGQENFKKAVSLILEQDKKWQSKNRGKTNRVTTQEIAVALTGAMRETTETEAARVFEEYARDPEAYIQELSRRTSEWRKSVSMSPEEAAEQRRKDALAARDTTSLPRVEEEKRGGILKTLFGGKKTER